MDITLDTPAIETTATPTLRYPVLMQAVENKHIVLFTNENEGTVLHVGYSSLSVGDHITAFKPASNYTVWTPFTGTLPLRNTTTP
jgi:hypothetical protein